MDGFLNEFLERTSKVQNNKMIHFVLRWEPFCSRHFSNGGMYVLLAVVKGGVFLGLDLTSSNLGWVNINYIKPPKNSILGMAIFVKENSDST